MPREEAPSSPACYHNEHEQCPKTVDPAFPHCGCDCHVVQPAKNRDGDQPLPVKNAHPFMQDLVMDDIEKRKGIGIQRYGTLLQPFNGRDFLRDAYEESLDQTMYLRGCLYERDGK